MFTSMRNGVLVTALLVASAAAQAQESHIPATTAAVTVGGVFTPSPSGSSRVGASDGSRTVYVPAGLRQPAPEPPFGAPDNMYLLMNSAPGNSISMVTSALTTANVGPQSAPLVNALAQLAGGTAGSVVSAVNAWNAAVSQMTVPQLRALLSTREGVAAVRMMKTAAEALLTRRSTYKSLK